MKETRFFIGFKKYLFKTNENIKITIPKKIAVRIINIFLSLITALTSFAFSVTTRYPIFFFPSLTFLIVTNKK